MSEKRIIEINGIKMEVDLSTAKRVDQFKIGDNVKVLIKENYAGQPYKVYAGTIIAFDQFREYPTITVAYIDVGYNSADIKYLYYNSETKDHDIVFAEDGWIPFTQSTVVEQMDREILKAERMLQELKQKKEFFLNNFNKYFADFKNK